MTAIKQCSKCGEIKQRTEFHVRRASNDGLTTLCKICAIKKAQVWYEQNLARKKAYDKKYQQKPSTKAVKRAYMERTRTLAAAKAKLWYENNKDRASEYLKRHYKANKAAYRAHARAWNKANPGKRNEWTAFRRAAQHSATPSWCDRRAIRQIYIRARADGMHVDHIVPLRSKLVCGLHVPWNLQLLPASENYRKLNVWWPDMP